MSNPTSIEKLIDGIEDLIKDDEGLTVVETVGALHLIAHRIMEGSFQVSADRAEAGE